MLVNLKEILEIAEKENAAIGAVNTPNFENLIAVIDAAEEMNVPIIISHAQVHEPIMELEKMGPVMVEYAKRTKVPVCVHLDHGEDLDYLERALEIGFTSIMYDGSVLSYEENIANTIKAVEMAKKYGASVEAELGSMGQKEDGEDTGAGAVYTDPDLAKDFCEKTKIDALAASFGTAHGVYTSKPKLDFDRIVKIKELVNIPLVMHGGSGVSPEDYKKAIDCGIRKINYYTYMSKAGMETAREFIANNEDAVYYHDMAKTVVNSMKNDIVKAMKIWYNK